MNQKVTTKGKIIGVTVNNAKSRQSNSSIGYFDLDDKSIIPYNLKHYLSNTLCLTSSAASSESLILASRLRHQLNSRLSSNNTGGKAKPVLDYAPSTQPHLGGTKSKTACGKATRSFQTRSVRKRSFQVSFELPWGQSDTIKHSAQTAFEPGKSGLAGLRGKFKSSKAPSSTHSLSFSILPHEVQKNQLLLSTWTWLSWSIEQSSPITGRVSRSLQRAGLCVLIGGFTAFLPYKEYSVRNNVICAKEAELQSFQILSMKGSNLNCVLSKDRVTHKYDRNWIS